MKTKKRKVIRAIDPEFERWLMKTVPSLLPVYLTLQPFQYAFSSWEAGPQKQAKNYDPDEPPYIYMQVNDPRYQGGDTEGVTLWCKITEDRIIMEWCCINGAGGNNYIDESEISLPGLWDYLQQIPKPYDYFCKGGDK